MNQMLLESLFKTAIEEGVLAGVILSALHNVCVHGEIFEVTGHDFKEKQLGRLFDGFEMSLKALRKIEKS